MTIPEWLVPLALIIGAIVTLWKALGKRTDHVETRLEERLQRTEERTTGRLERMEHRLLSAIRSVLPVGDVVASRSPIALTPLGKNVANDMEADTWAENLASQLATDAGTRNFEIQEFAFEYVERKDTFRSAKRDRIREVAYNHGLQTYAVRRVLAIKLRDQLLKLAGLQPPE